jgi:hypothetical protein
MSFSDNNYEQTNPEYDHNKDQDTGEIFYEVTQSTKNTPFDSGERCANDTKSFASEAIDNLEDGNKVTIIVSKNNTTKRIDLIKGITKVETETTKSSTNIFGWKGIVFLAFGVIPWVIGVDKIANHSYSYFKN